LADYWAVVVTVAVVSVAGAAVVVTVAAVGADKEHFLEGTEDWAEGL
jgi:hypothetical protein